MTEIIQDAFWQSLLRDAMKEHREEEIAVRVANSIWRARAQYTSEKAKKQTIMFLEKAPVAVRQSRTVTRCRATNLNNTPCQFKAVCGNYCKKHQPVEEI
jgi:hypothetical protein